MRIDREGLIELSLKTLAEQVELASAAPPRPSHGVRLALKVLHMFSAGEQAPFVDFWRQMRNDESVMKTETIASYCRSTHLQAQLRGVMRAVGIEPTVAVEQSLAHAALKIYPRTKVKP
ncbi:hypothetical protein [Sphingopyxis sp. FD7]|jgi:hypothetical protein|uniref:hypothetical protein n=1 Tax=Sphingopyxis sp. FD7 TaxID=1914525 RepID=UPI000DC63F67|nr:hypothetical protein [Sphingopyxis sp. FD7]BBB13667.1 vitellogenin-1 [Sphingopyxis sp. FD7]